VEKFAAGTLFPNQEENQADELEDMNGETTINDGDKVPMETLVHVWSKMDPTQLLVMMMLMTIAQ
jgi:hypothetical protein